MVMRIDELIAQKQKGAFLGRSRWFEVTHKMIEAHAQMTFDSQPIHLDPEIARKSGFDGTIAHGFLSLSLLSAMLFDILAPLEKGTMLVNYGFDRIRFVAPVPSGSKLAGAFRLNDVIPCPSSENVTLHLGVTLILEKDAQTALIADWIVRRSMALSEK